MCTRSNRCGACPKFKFFVHQPGRRLSAWPVTISLPVFSRPVSISLAGAYTPRRRLGGEPHKAACMCISKPQNKKARAALFQNVDRALGLPMLLFCKICNLSTAIMPYTVVANAQSSLIMSGLWSKCSSLSPNCNIHVATLVATLTYECIL